MVLGPRAETAFSSAEAAAGAALPSGGLTEASVSSTTVEKARREVRVVLDSRIRDWSALRGSGLSAMFAVLESEER